MVMQAIHIDQREVLPLSEKVNVFVSKGAKSVRRSRRISSADDSFIHGILCYFSCCTTECTSYGRSAWSSGGRALSTAFGAICGFTGCLGTLSPEDGGGGTT